MSQCKVVVKAMTVMGVTYRLLIAAVSIRNSAFRFQAMPKTSARSFSFRAHSISSVWNARTKSHRLAQADLLAW